MFLLHVFYGVSAQIKYSRDGIFLRENIKGKYSGYSCIYMRLLGGGGGGGGCLRMEILSGKFTEVMQQCSSNADE